METRNDKESTIEDQGHEATMKDSIVDAPKGPPPGLSDGVRGQCAPDCVSVQWLILKEKPSRVLPSLPTNLPLARHGSAGFPTR